MKRLLASFFRMFVNTTSFTGSVFKVPGGIVADNVGMWGLFGAMQNLDSLDYDINAVAIGTATTFTLTGAQIVSGVTDISGSPGSGVTLNTPTAAQIIAALSNTIPSDGINISVYLMNDGTGQTLTLTAGTGVTIIGNATISTNTVRQFIMAVNVNSGTVNMLNLGTQNL